MLSLLLISLIALASCNDSVVLAGYDSENTRDFPSDISTRNIARLRVKWDNATTCFGKSATATPLVRGDRLCVPDFGGCYSCWSRATGALILRKQLSVDYGFPYGYLSRTTPSYIDGVVILGSNARVSIFNATEGTWVFGVDFFTGDLIWKKTVSSNNWTLVTQSPITEGRYFYLGISSSETSAPYSDPGAGCCKDVGTFYKYRASDGQMIWSTPMVPPELQGYEGYSGCGIWGSTPVIVGNSIYISTGQLSHVPNETAACILANPLNASCIPRSVLFDSVVRLDKRTGVILNSYRASPADIWNVACYFGGLLPGCQCLGVCDYDYDITTVMYSKKKDILFAASKSGFVFALTPDLQLLWVDQLVNGSANGGMVWQNALRDNNRLSQIGFFIHQTNDKKYNYTLPNGTNASAGAFVRYDGSGNRVWVTPTPNKDGAYGPVALTNDILFGSTKVKGLLLAMDADTGEIVWQHQTNGSMSSGCAIVDSEVYWPLGPGSVLVPGVVDQDRVVCFTVDRE